MLACVEMGHYQDVKNEEKSFYREGFSGWFQRNPVRLAISHQPGIGHAYGDTTGKGPTLLCPKNDEWLLVGRAEMSAASQVRRWRPELDILVFERSLHMSYSACGIPYYVGNVLRKVEAFL